MLLDLARREKVAKYLKTFNDYPLELLQQLPIEVQMLHDNIGDYEFSTLLLDVSHAVRNNRHLHLDWSARVRRGNSTRDADSIAALTQLYELVHSAKMNVHKGFFPYEITRTKQKNVICYRKLQGLKLAEHAAELIDESYSTPPYLIDPITDDDIIAHLAALREESPY